MFHVRVGLHEDAHVKVLADCHYHEVQREGDVDTFLLWPFARPVARRPAPWVTESSHSEVNQTRLPPRRSLAQASSVALWVACCVRLATVDPHLVKLAVEWAVAGEMLGKRHGVNLALPVWRTYRAECLPRALIDVLPVEEHDDAGGLRQTASPSAGTRSGSASPSRRLDSRAWLSRARHSAASVRLPSAGAPPLTRVRKSSATEPNQSG